MYIHVLLNSIITGIITKSTGALYLVQGDDGYVYSARIKGAFKAKGIRTTNPVAIGDRVVIELPSERHADNIYWITEILPRKNYIIRRASNLSKEAQIIGANLDRCVLIVTANYPFTSTTFIDRFLTTAEAYSVPATLVFNKVDRYNTQDLKYYHELKSLYRQIGYACFGISAINKTGLNEIAEHLSTGISLLSGHSGVGKSTLINALVPDANLRTGTISDAHQTGTHTTTYSEMIPYAGGYLIDTPGIRGFGAVDFEEHEVCHFFPELFEFSKGCRFSNCSHTHEPGCNVLRALTTGEIAESRYKSYLSLLHEDKESKYRTPF